LHAREVVVGAGLWQGAGLESQAPLGEDLVGRQVEVAEPVDEHLAAQQGLVTGLARGHRAATSRPPRGHLQGDLLERRIQGGLGKSAGLRSDNSRAAERLLLARSA
jgi:hypothetical protein